MTKGQRVNYICDAVRQYGHHIEEGETVSGLLLSARAKLSKKYNKHLCEALNCDIKLRKENNEIIIIV